MSDMPVALRPGSAHSFIDWGFSARMVGVPPDISALPSRVEIDARRGTGRSATAPNKSALADIWKVAAEGFSDAAWTRLPDQALEVLEDRQEGATSDDLSFLADVAARSSNAAIAAVRLLGSIGEEGLAPQDHVRGLLLDLLEDRSAATRVAVVQSFWQMADRSVVQHLNTVLKHEAHPEVRRTLEHVVRVLS